MQLNDYQQAALKTYSFDHPILHPAIGLSEEAGEVMGCVKRFIRDDQSKLTPERREKIKGELGDTLWYLSVLAYDCGLTMNEVAEFNLQKLASRKERGKLKGEGGDR